MKSETDDRNAREMIGPVLKKAGFEIISINEFDEGEYWIRIRRNKE